MRFFLISDNSDTREGMRLAGIEGVVAHEADAVMDALEKAAAAPDIGLVLLTAKLSDLCRDEIREFKLSHSRPLIVEVPDRHGRGGVSEAITRYVREAVGIQI
jgi:V/A-type H+-transporting ATPase subunit F